MGKARGKTYFRFEFPNALLHNYWKHPVGRKIVTTGMGRRWGRKQWKVFQRMPDEIIHGRGGKRCQHRRSLVHIGECMNKWAVTWSSAIALVIPYFITFSTPIWPPSLGSYVHHAPSLLKEREISLLVRGIRGYKVRFQTLVYVEWDSDPRCSGNRRNCSGKIRQYTCVCLYSYRYS